MNFGTGALWLVVGPLLHATAMNIVENRKDNLP
jgi:hypothetical protein